VKLSQLEAAYLGEEGKAASMRRIYQRKISEGQCANCPSPAVPGKRRCQQHLDFHKKEEQERRRYRAKNGLCKICGRPLGESGFLLHARSECVPWRRRRVSL